MSEIIRKGKRPLPIPSDPIGKKYLCPICDAVFEVDREGFLNSEPEVVLLMEGRSRRGLAYSIKCPGSLDLFFNGGDSESEVWAEHRVVLEAPLEVSTD